MDVAAFSSVEIMLPLQRRRAAAPARSKVVLSDYNSYLSIVMGYVLMLSFFEEHYPGVHTT